MKENIDQTEDQYAAYIGIDWADQKHVFSLQAAGSSVSKDRRLPSPWSSRAEL